MQPGWEFYVFLPPVFVRLFRRRAGTDAVAQAGSLPDLAPSASLRAFAPLKMDPAISLSCWQRLGNNPHTAARVHVCPFNHSLAVAATIYSPNARFRTAATRLLPIFPWREKGNWIRQKKIKVSGFLNPYRAEHEWQLILRLPVGVWWRFSPRVCLSSFVLGLSH